jgi:hypothetical protein
LDFAAGGLTGVDLIAARGLCLWACLFANPALDRAHSLLGLAFGHLCLSAVISVSMSDDLNFRLATLTALLELDEAVTKDDLKAAQDCRDKRLILALDLFSADRKRREALQQLFDLTGRWVSGVGSADLVREALKRAIPLFEH